MNEDALEQIRDVARRAGQVILEARDHGVLGVENKPDDFGPVTLADRRANTLIVEAIRDAFPGDSIVAEESAEPAHRTRRTWFVDPLDGTVEFIAGRDQFAVMIGLVVDGIPELGVVFQPTLDRLAYATREGGAWLVDCGRKTRLLVSAIDRPAEARALVSRSHPCRSVDRALDTLKITSRRKIGSCGLKIVEIAGGSADLYLNLTGKVALWDAAAPHAILLEAGGSLTSASGPIDYEHDPAYPGTGFVATNSRIHSMVLAALPSRRGLA